MTVKQRIIEFLKYKKIGQAAFEKSCGLSNGYVNNIVNTIGNKKLQNIIQIYPELDPVWLMMGKGEMILKSANNLEIEDKNQTINLDNMNLLEENQKLKQQVERLEKMVDRLMDENDNLKSMNIVKRGSNAS